MRALLFILLRVFCPIACLQDQHAIPPEETPQEWLLDLNRVDSPGGNGLRTCTQEPAAQAQAVWGNRKAEVGLGSEAIPMEARDGQTHHCHATERSGDSRQADIGNTCGADNNDHNQCQNREERAHRQKL